MCQQIERGGTTVGAFCNDRLIGFCCVDGTISGTSAKYANLTILFVDDYWKRNGIGKLLMQEARNHATKSERKRYLYRQYHQQRRLPFI